MLTDKTLGLPYRFLKSLYNFLYFWYIKSSKDFWAREINFIKGVERDVGVLINLRLITQPIFGDYSYIGRIIGPFFRLGRVVFGCIMIALSTLVIFIIYIFWLLSPVVAVFMTFENLFYVLVN
ncbi:MAG: hypothetical protein WC178_03220 [Candidatus Paceibacterota bacterium]